MTDLQTEMFRSPRGAIMALDSAADVLPRNRGYAATRPPRYPAP